MKSKPVLPKEKAKNKNVLVQDYIKNLFISGKLSVGGAIPSERRLADLVKVSYLTARRGVEQLIQEGICYRIRRKTFIHANASSIFESNHLNVVLSEINPYTLGILEHLKAEAKRIHWGVQITFLHNLNDSRVAKIFQSQIPTCILGGVTDLSGSVGSALRESKGWVVSVGFDLEIIPSVISAGNHGIIRGLIYLITQGHREIAFVTSDFHHNIDQAVLNWKSCGLSDKIQERSFVVKADLASFPSEIHASYAAVKQALGKNKFRPTALFCHNDYAAIGARHACLDLGIEIPKDISIISIGTTPLTEFCIPQLTTVDVNFRDHAIEALNYLKGKISGAKTERIKIEIDLKITEGKSVKKNKSLS